MFHPQKVQQANLWVTLHSLEFSHISVVIVFASVKVIDNYECREVDSGTRYLRRRLVGRTSEEKLLGIIVFRTINRSSFLILSLAQVKSRQLELNLNQLLS